MAGYISDDTRKVTTHRLVEMKQRGEKISMLTSYDYTMAQIVDGAGMDVILVGDSASNVMAGNVTTLPITLDQMIYHAKSVVRGVKRAMVVVDMPFGSYQGNEMEGLASAIRIMKESHADALKLEGGEEIIGTVKRILSAGIPIMGHLGLMPQSINKYGTYTVRAKDDAEAEKLVRDAHLLEEAGCRVKRGAQISVKPPSGKRFIRLDSLSAAYTEAALRNVLGGSQVHIPRIPRSQYTGRQIALLIDIEKKMREGKGRGYQVWAERHNLDAVSQSIIYLKENGINSYEELMRRIDSGTKRRNQLKDSMKTCQTRMKAVSEQRKAVLTYRRTQAIYVQYRESGWSPQFYQAHAKEIEAHKAAQAVYAKADGKLPTLAELSAEYERLLCQKRADSTALAEAKAEVSSLWHIKTNMDTIASDEPIEEKETSRADRNAR